LLSFRFSFVRLLISPLLPYTTLSRSGSAMNRFYKTVLSWFAAPRLSMREHYEAVRRLQRRLATFALLPPRLRSWHTAQSDSGFQVPVRIFQPKQKTRDEVLVFF